MTNLNSGYISTKSNKIRKITVLKKFMVDIIDDNQNIKRFMRHITKLPLAKKSEDYNGNIKVQSDIRNSLLIGSDEGEQCLYNGGFNPEMSNIKMPYIFVNSYRSYITGVDQSIYFAIHILCPEKYNGLLNYGDERIYEIANEIAQLLDGYTIEKEDIVKKAGNLKIEINGEITESRMSKSNDIIVLSIPIKIKNIALRS